MPRTKGSKNKKPKRQYVERKSENEIVQDRLVIQKLHLEGYNQFDIAAKIGRSQAFVSLELKEIRREFREEYLDERKVLAMQETLVLKRTRQEAFEAIERIKQLGKRKKVTKTGGKIKLDGEEYDAEPEITETEEDETIAPYLEIIIRTEQQMARLWGLEELPKTVLNVMNVQSSGAFFDSLQRALVEGEPEDPLVARIKVEGETIDVPKLEA